MGLAGIVIGIFSFGGFEWLERQTYNLRMQSRGSHPSQVPVMLVLQDEETAQYYATASGRLSRHIYAAAIRNLSRAGARLILMDVLVSDPGLDEEDALLEDAIREAKTVVLAAYIGAEGYRLPLARFYKHALGQGFINVMPDADGILRSAPLLGGEIINGEWAPVLSLGAEATRLSQDNEGTIQVEVPSATTVRLGSFEIPLLKGQVLINYAGPPGTFPNLPLWKVATGHFFPDQVKDHIVLMGSNLASTHDFYPTPFTQKVVDILGVRHDTGSPVQMPGVEIHANAVHTLLTQQWIVRSEGEQVLVWIGVLWALCCIFILLYPQGELGVIISTLILLGGIISIAVALFWHRNYWLDMVPLIALINGHFALATGYQRYLVVRQKKQIRSLFSQFLSPDLLEEVWNNRKALGTHQEFTPRECLATILLIKFPNRANVVPSLSSDNLLSWWESYRSAVGFVLSKEKRLVGAWELDGIRVYFGLPLASDDSKILASQAGEARECAVKVSQAVGKINERWVQKGVAPLGVWMMMYTGPVTAGSVGTNGRGEYRVMGEAVEMTEYLYRWARGKMGDVDSFLALFAEPHRTHVKGLQPFQRIGVLKGWKSNGTVEIFCLLSDSPFPSNSDNEGIARGERL